MEKRRDRILRGGLLLLAALLVASYFRMPIRQEENGSNNSNGRRKQELSAGESLSWSWAPTSERIRSLVLWLSGMGDAQGLTLEMKITDQAGAVVATLTQPVSRLEGDKITLSGDLAGGRRYTVTLSAAGEGTVKVRGMEEQEGFYPWMRWDGFRLNYNPSLLYLAGGLLLLALTPLSNGRVREKRIRGQRGGWLAAMTFGMIAAVGLVIVFGKPLYAEDTPFILWDEEIHRVGAMKCTLVEMGRLDKVMSGVSSWTPGYLPLILGADLAGIFTRDPNAIYRTAAAMNVLCYAALSALAVYRAPRYRAVFAVAAMLPTCVYLATGFSYDATVIGAVLLATALCLEIWCGEDQVTARQMIILLGLCAFGTVSKPAYSLVLLLALLLPARRLGSRGQAWLYRGMVLLLLVWCMGAMALPGVYDNVRSGDQRYAGTDMAAQVQGLLSNPLDIVRVPATYVLKYPRHVFFTGIAHWAYLGNHDTLNLIFPLLLLIAAPLAVCGEKPEGTPVPGPGRRLALAGCGLMVLFVLILAQYLASSPVGGPVTGYQSRYVLPVWILLALALSAPEALRRCMRRVGPWLAALTVSACFGLNLWYALSYLTV